MVSNLDSDDTLVKSHLYAIGLDVNGDSVDQMSYRDIAVRTKELNHMHVDSVTNDFREGES